MTARLQPVTAGPRGRRSPDWLSAQLPLGLAEDDLLRRFVALFQAVSDTVLEHVDNLGLLLDPAVAPPAMLRFLGGWLGEATLDDTLDDLVARRWVSASAELLRWRGTARGLRLLLELISGRPVELSDDGGVYAEGEDDRPACDGHVVIGLQQLGALSEEDLLQLIRRELPAAVTFELYVAGVALWPPVRHDLTVPDHPLFLEDDEDDDDDDVDLS